MVLRVVRLAVVGLLVVTAGCFDSHATHEEQSSSAPPATAQFPALTGRVVDEANLLSSEQEIDIASKSQALEAMTGRQFVVATVSSLNGVEIAIYARDLGRYWGIGRKGHNDGVILLVAPNERNVRIAVGYGLEKSLTNEIAAKIVDNVILPAFRDGEMGVGIVRGADAIVEQLSDSEKVKGQAGAPGMA